MFKVFFERNDDFARAALFLSGTGTNAVNLLTRLKNNPEAHFWRPAVMVTDRPESSAARTLAARFDIPLVESDIAAFYRSFGKKKVSIADGEGWRIRELWTESLREKLAPFQIDFGIMAGFVPLTNIVKDFPCLNVHPGDLTVEEGGRRIFAGLHRIPVENALLKQVRFLRSSVIVVQPFTPGASEMDSGPVLGVSAPVPLDWDGFSAEELAAAAGRRKALTREEIASDPLARVAEKNLERLKTQGDWVVFPPVVNDFAAGKFLSDEEGRLFRTGEDGVPVHVKTVEYFPDGTVLPRCL